MNLLIEVWVFEILKGIGRFLLHPLVYIFLAMSVYLGYIRVKRERKRFHVRTFYGLTELKLLVPTGFLIGLIISVLTIVTGVVLPFYTIILLACFTVLLALIGKTRNLSPVFIIGLSFFTIIFLRRVPVEHAILTELQETSIHGMVVLLSLLVIAEGFLIYKKAHLQTSPEILMSKRGQAVGAHISNKLWMVPVFLFIPGDALSLKLDWWPLFSVDGEQYALFLVPFGIGFSQKIKSMLPKKGAEFVGVRVISLGILLVALALASLWFPVIAIMAISFAMVSRELISLQFRVLDDSNTFYYTRKKNGLIVLGIIPKSPADKMGIQIGEIVSKVNGSQVRDEEDFYQSLQKNRAFCKLEVIGLNGEMRFVQGALYDGEHHELGILFVQDEKKWKHEAV